MAKDDCSCEKECACDDDAVPDPNDPNTSQQWKNAFLKARGISYGSLGTSDEDDPEPWQVEAARRKLAPQDRGPRQPEEADEPDQPPFKSGCTDDDCAQMFSHGCRKEDCEPRFASLGGHDSDDDEAPRPSMSLSGAPDEHPYPPFADTSRLKYEKAAKFRSAGEEKEEKEEEESGWQSAEGSEEESGEESEDDWREEQMSDYYRMVADGLRR